MKIWKEKMKKMKMLKIIFSSFLNREAFGQKDDQ